MLRENQMATRILLADDSITIQKVVNLTFADEGIEVVAVSNGDLAERRLAEVAPDLVLADIFMPGKNGYELCESIKENPQFRNVPVVLLVGAFEPFDQAEARRVRADAHLTKPFESRTLVETVRRLISASSQTTTGPIAPMPEVDDERDEALDALAPVTDPAPLAYPLEGKLDPSAMMADKPVAPSSRPNRTTGELASPTLDAQPEAVDPGSVDAPALEAASATLTDTKERFEPLEPSSNGDYSHDNVAPAFDLDADEMIGDFDMSEPVETAASHDPISLETEPSPVLDVDSRGAGEGEDWFDSTSFQTTRLDRSGDSAWQPPATRSALSYQSPDFRLQTEGTIVASEASTETACATLLAVDEPLGDVLFDEAVSADPLALSEMLSGDSLGLELPEPEVAEPGRSESTQFNLVDIGADSTPEELFTIDETPPAEVYVTAEEPPTTAESPDSVAAGPPPDLHPASDDVAHDLDWTTPRAAAYSTAQLDPVVMPADVAEYPAENSADETPQQPKKAEEASFATSTTWTEEEARFTPIDIEAAEVEAASAGEVSAVETGFAFSSLPDEPPASSETPVATAAQEQASASPTTDLSAAAIEAIVRRVVAEMSESVVREVAWEVVPDCVERVIEQLTRESLSKRA
jgi:CheY-like chemotaxis protein/histone H3/H4